MTRLVCPIKLAVSRPVSESQSLTSARGCAAIRSAHRGDRTAVGRKGHVIHAVACPEKTGDLLAGRYVPDLGLLLVAGRGDPAAVRRESHGVGWLLVRREWSRRSSPERRPRAGWFRRRRPWPGACPSGEKSASLTDARAHLEHPARGPGGGVPEVE